MPTETTPADLLDLKLLPAWVNEPARPNDYANFEGEEEHSPRRGGSGPNRDRDRDRRSPRPRDKSGPRSRDDRPRRPRPERSEAPRGNDRHRERERQEPIKPLAVAVRFLPHAPALHNVIAQIKEGSVAYSVFALARLFLEKPERYDVHLTAKPESPLYQLGENGAIAADRSLLENNAFRSAKEDFYKIDIGLPWRRDQRRK